MKKITKFAAALVIGSALSTSMAQAADMDPIMEAYDWSGSYFGIKLGYGDGKQRTLGSNTGISEPSSIDGFVGGIMSGYNFQSGNIVFGLDSDFAFADVDGTANSLPTFTNTTHVDVETLSTTRARIGFAMDRFLPYITAGLATGYVDAVDSALGGGKSRLHVGFAAGGGVEWAFMDGWSARAEALYVDLGKRSHNFGGTAARVDVKDMVVIRGGISMKTGWIWDSIMGAR